MGNIERGFDPIRDSRSGIRKLAVTDPAGTAHRVIEQREEIERLRCQLRGAVEERDRWKALADAALGAVPQDHPDLGVWLVEYADLGGQ